MEDAVNQDEEQLRLLSVFHYVVGGITGLFALFPIFHLLFGLFMVCLPDTLQNGGDAPPAFVGWIFIGFAGLIIAMGWTVAGLIIAAGRSLAKRRGYLFCLVVAGIECMLMPHGTVLGVFTIIVLMRESVKEAFLANKA